MRSGTRVLSGAAVSKGDARSITDADGNYVLRHHDAGSIWSGGSAPLAVHAHGLEYQVRLPHDDYRNTAPTLDVQLGEHELIVDVADLRGQPCAATLVFSGGAPAEIGQVHAVQGTRPIQSGDRVRLALLPRCRMRIEATFASGVVDVAEVDIPTTPYVLVQDRPCGTLRVRTLADCGVTARTWRGKGPAPVGEGQFTDAWYRGGNTDSDGRVVLRGVIAGEILLRVDGPGSSKALRFALAPGETKDLVVDLPR